MNSMKPTDVMRKVPEVTVFFWIVKVLTTAVGESTSDYLVHVMEPIAAVGIGAIGFAIAMFLQFKTHRYIAWVYWLAVSMVAIFGTMAADVVHVGLGVPYLYSTVFFTIAIVAIFALWYFVEGTLSIHSINTKRREFFYWTAVCATFALGTAAGDLVALTLSLGYLDAGIIFGLVIALVAVSHYAAKGVLRLEHKTQSRNAVLAFWLAYIFTRPFGASFADWTGKDQSFGGLGWGDGRVSVGLALLIIAFVAYLSATHVDVEDEHPSVRVRTN